MSLFEYQAFFSGGKKTKGILSADSLDEAKAILHQKSLIIYKISFIKKNQKKNLTKKEVLFIVQQLENLLSAGIPLYESLIILTNKNEKKKVKLLLLDLCEKIKSGYTLSEAMKTHPKSFDLIICFMVENAQKTGRLEKCLSEISKILSSSLQLKKRLISAFTYPIVLFSFCFVVLNFLLFFTIPSLFDLFEGRQLHPFTKMVFFVSRFVCKYKAFIFLGFVVFFILILISYFYDPLRKKIYAKFLGFPVFKSFMIKVALIRFCISFANLLKGGETYVNSLTLAANVLNHPILENEIIPLKDKLTEGKHLSELLQNNEYIPEIIPKMLAIAEETSQMPKILFNIAKIYEEEVDKFLSKITSIFQPVMLIILGLIVGFVVLSILIPLTDVSSFIGEEKL
jgi:general secretion pathway protein F/type IV pilus assembly protein PilC